jgi:hypothetical protein
MQSMFSGLHGVEVGEAAEVSLGGGFSLVRTNNYLLSARDKRTMTGDECQESANVSRYLVYKHETPASPPQTYEETYEEIKNTFSSGLMALQVLKPIRTLGIVFYGQFYDEAPGAPAVFSLQRIERRPPMVPGPWACRKAFDQEMLKRMPATIDRVQQIMKGPNAERRNAFILLQLGLEHFHPLVAGLLWVTGLEAIIDSGGKERFKQKLCDCLGENSLVFPDWDSQQRDWTVGAIAIDLYVLRNKLAHGADLRKAVSDAKYPVDLTEKRTLPGSSDQGPYSSLLSEAACYLLCQVLQKEIART